MSRICFKIVCFKIPFKKVSFTKNEIWRDSYWERDCFYDSLSQEKKSNGTELVFFVCKKDEGKMISIDS